MTYRRKRGPYRGRWQENRLRDRTIAKEYERGESGIDLALRYGMTAANVYDILKKQDVDVRA